MIYGRFLNLAIQFMLKLLPIFVTFHCNADGKACTNIPEASWNENKLSIPISTPFLMERHSIHEYLLKIKVTSLFGYENLAYLLNKFSNELKLLIITARFKLRF